MDARMPRIAFPCESFTSVIGRANGCGTAQAVVVAIVVVVCLTRNTIHSTGMTFMLGNCPED